MRRPKNYMGGVARRTFCNGGVDLLSNRPKTLIGHFFNGSWGLKIVYFLSTVMFRNSKVFNAQLLRIDLQ